MENGSSPDLKDQFKKRSKLMIKTVKTVMTAYPFTRSASTAIIPASLIFLSIKYLSESIVKNKIGMDILIASTML